MSKTFVEDKFIFISNNGNLGFQSEDFKIFLWKSINAEEELNVSSQHELTNKYDSIIIGHDGKKPKNMTFEFKWLSYKTKYSINYKIINTSLVGDYNLSTNLTSQNFFDHIKFAGVKIAQSNLNNIPSETVRINYFEVTARVYVFLRSVFINDKYFIEVYFAVGYSSNTLNLSGQSTLVVNLTDFEGISFKSK